MNLFKMISIFQTWIMIKIWIDFDFKIVNFIKRKDIDVNYESNIVIDIYF
jgi:hypothetical protein